MRRAGRVVSQDPRRDSISASTITIVMVFIVMVFPAAAIVMIAVASFATLAPIMAAALVDHRRWCVITGRFVDHRRRLSPPERVDINPDVSVGVRGAGRHRQPDNEK
jgi:hypothetical protein